MRVRYNNGFKINYKPCLQCHICLKRFNKIINFIRHQRCHQVWNVFYRQSQRSWSTAQPRNRREDVTSSQTKISKIDRKQCERKALKSVKTAKTCLKVEGQETRSSSRPSSKYTGKHITTGYSKQRKSVTIVKDRQEKRSTLKSLNKKSITIIKPPKKTNTTKVLMIKKPKTITIRTSITDIDKMKKKVSCTVKKQRKSVAHNKETAQKKGKLWLT